MPRFERSDDGVFWEIERDGCSIATRWGRIGAAGMSSKKLLESEPDAIAAYDQQVSQRVRNGYVPIAIEEPPPQPSTPPLRRARDPELEAAIRAAPGDREPKLVYADWLTEQGDPRGELITLYDAFEGEQDHTRLLDRKRDLEARAAMLVEHLWQDLLPYHGEVTLGWQTGFIASAKLYPRAAPLAPVIERLLPLPSAIALAKLEVRAPGYRDFGAVIAAIAAHRPPLRALELIGAHDALLGSLVPLYSVCGELRSLALRGPFELGAVDLPCMQTLALGFATRATFDALAAARAPELRELRLDHIASAVHLASLAVTESLPALRVLQIANVGGDQRELITSLAAAPLTRRLTRLSIPVDDTAVETMYAHAPAFAHLERLRVCGDLSASSLRRLATHRFIDAITTHERYGGTGE